jgi:hypothetical protein
MKVQDFGLVCTSKKNGKKLPNSKCKVVKDMVVLEDVGVGENGAKTFVVRKYSPTHPRFKMWRKCL